MNSTRKTEIKVGVTVVVGILLTLWILGWAKNVDLFTDKPVIKILFNSVAGLESGDRFSVNGVRKGVVDNIETLDGGVIVTVSLEPDTDLRADANFSIMMLDLMGGKKIEVSPGESETKLDLTKIHRGKFSGDISTAMASISDVQEDLVDVIKEIKISLININSFMGDKKFINDVKKSVTNLNDLIVVLNDVTDENRNNLKNLLVNVDTLVTNSTTFLAENKNVVADLTSGINTSLNKTNELIDKISQLADETKAKNNNLGKLLYDENLLNDLKNTINRTNQLFDILIKQLESDGVNVDVNIF